MTENNFPYNVVTKEVLNIIFLFDTSYSMVNGRIGQVNSSMPALKEDLIRMAEEEGVDIKVRAIAFNDKAEWVIGSVDAGVNIEEVVWHDLNVDGGTSTYKAIEEANKALAPTYLGRHALRPVVVLVTDGGSNPGEHDKFKAAIAAMNKKLASQADIESGISKVTRVAIGVDGYNRAELEEFASSGMINDQQQPLVFEVDKATDLGKVINWVTVTSLYSSITDNEEDIPSFDDWTDIIEPNGDADGDDTIE